MPRKSSKRKTDRIPARSSRALVQEGDGFVFIRPRGPEHRRALLRLEKKFGRGEFSPDEVVRTGIDSRILRELVQLQQVLQLSEDLFSINQDASSHAAEIKTPADFVRTDFAMFEQLPDDSPLKQKLQSDPPPTPEQMKAQADVILREFEPMHVTKRFLMPYSLYLDVRPDFENLSAYIRYLIYTDRGMKKEAAMEKKRMGATRPRKRKRAS